MVSYRNRRDVLKRTGSIGLLGLAGCLGGDDDGTTADGTTAGNTPTTDGAPTGTAEGETTAAVEAEVETRTIRMGMLMGVTGELTDLGPPIRDAAMLAVDQINEGDTEFSVDVQFEDTGTDPNTGISNANALINAGYPMICGALSSGVTIQVANNALVPNGVVGCSPASTAPAITTLDDNDLVFRTPPSDEWQGAVMAQVTSETIQAGTAATLYLNNEYGQLLSESFSASFREQHGGTVTNQVAFERGQASYTSQLRTAMNDDPELLMVVAYPESGVQLFRDFYAEFDPELPVLVADGLRDPTLPGDVGEDMTNVRGTAPLSAGPGREFFADRFVEAHGDEPGVFTGQGYDAAATLMLANAAAGENEGSTIRDRMRAVANPDGTEITPENLVEGIERAAAGEEIDYRGASSAVDFDENGDMQAITYEFFRFTADGLQTVREIEFQTEEGSGVGTRTGEGS